MGTYIKRDYEEPLSIVGAKYIQLGHGEFAIIDEEDYEKVSKYVWRKATFGHAFTTTKRDSNGKQKTILMHRLVLDFPESWIDHRNCDPADNRKSNLRLCTPSQNQKNRKKKEGTSTSKYKGVVSEVHSGKWRAAIHIGSYDTEEEAAAAYNKIAELLFGEFAYLNKLPSK